MNEKLFTILGVKYAYITSLHEVSTENGYVPNYYAATTCLDDSWSNSSVEEDDDDSFAARCTIMQSDRVYVDTDSNMMRFKVSKNECDPVNDYYCVAMGPGFAKDAAELCEKKTPHR